MKRLIPLLAAALLVFSCEKSPKNTSYDVPTPTFAKGADVSWVSEMEYDGKTFKTKKGEQADIFTSLESCGINAIRLRVWVKCWLYRFISCMVLSFWMEYSACRLSHE